MSYWLRARVVVHACWYSRLKHYITYTAPRLPAAKPDKADIAKPKAKAKNKQGAKAKAKQEDDEDENPKPAKKPKK